jgi:ubiquitin C-terminal hydrolase
MQTYLHFTSVVISEIDHKQLIMCTCIGRFEQQSRLKSKGCYKIVPAPHTTKL